jgi:ketosteroid isomerase-like protein
MEIAALIDRYDAAWNAQDLDTVASMHDDAIVFYNHSAGERVAGAAAVRAHIAVIFARCPTLRFERRALAMRRGFCGERVDGARDAPR